MFLVPGGSGLRATWRPGACQSGGGRKASIGAALKLITGPGPDSGVTALSSASQHEGQRETGKGIQPSSQPSSQPASHPTIRPSSHQAVNESHRRFEASGCRLQVHRCSPSQSPAMLECGLCRCTGAVQLRHPSGRRGERRKEEASRAMLIGSSLSFM